MDVEFGAYANASVGQWRPTARSDASIRLPCPLIGIFDDDLNLHLRKHVGGFETTDSNNEGFTTEVTCSPVMYLDAANCERRQTGWSRVHNAVDDTIGVGKFGGRQGLNAYAELFT